MVYEKQARPHERPKTTKRVDEAQPAGGAARRRGHPAQAHHYALQDPSALNRDEVMQLQRTIGNRAVLALFARANARALQAKADGPAALEPPAYGVSLVDAGATVQRRADAARLPNRTGLPDRLKAGVESLSGLSMDAVRVHYNSSRPAELRALAYTQGTDIHVGPGQERHLPHEAWHVVQQAQGRVQATTQMMGLGVNYDAGLESEADVMGGRAALGEQVGEMALSGGMETAEMSAEFSEKCGLKSLCPNAPIQGNFLETIHQTLESPARTLVDKLVWLANNPTSQDITDVQVRKQLDCGALGFGSVDHLNKIYQIQGSATLPRPSRSVALVNRQQSGGDKSWITPIGKLGAVEDTLRGRSKATYNGGHLIRRYFVGALDNKGANDTRNVAPQVESSNQYPGAWRVIEELIRDRAMGVGAYIEATVTYPDQTYTVPASKLFGYLKRDSARTAILANHPYIGGISGKVIGAGAQGLSYVGSIVGVGTGLLGGLWGASRSLASGDVSGVLTEAARGAQSGNELGQQLPRVIDAGAGLVGGSVGAISGALRGMYAGATGAGSWRGALSGAVTGTATGTATGTVTGAREGVKFTGTTTHNQPVVFNTWTPSQFQLNYTTLQFPLGTSDASGLLATGLGTLSGLGTDRLYGQSINQGLRAGSAALGIAALPAALVRRLSGGDNRLTRFLALGETADEGLGYRAEGVTGGTFVTGNAHASHRFIGEVLGHTKHTLQIATVLAGLSLVGIPAVKLADVATAIMLGGRSLITSLQSYLPRSWASYVGGMLGVSDWGRSTPAPEDVPGQLRQGVGQIHDGVQRLYGQFGEGTVLAVIGLLLSGGTVGAAAATYLAVRNYQGLSELVNRYLRPGQTPVFGTRLLLP